MLITKSVEQGIVALLMLAVQEGHTPVTGAELAGVMGVSESYLQKTMRKLVVASLVESIRSRDGGFVLARPIDQISLGDACRALVGDDLVFGESGLARSVFTGCDGIPASEGAVQEALLAADEAFMAVLDGHPLSQLLRPGVWAKGTRDWPRIAARIRENTGNVDSQ